MSPQHYAIAEGFASAAARKKRLGQYFSGQQVARLLAALAHREGIRSVIDPMAGRGDMLAAAGELLPHCRQLHGIEIDPVARRECSKVLIPFSTPDSQCLCGSAFDPEQVKQLNSEGYDLVITNPPYVRYQSLKDTAGIETRLPSALEVRNGLLGSISGLSTLDEMDKAAFAALAVGYSGLSDLAVPSWILCAALVKNGGTLAMVVPESWLNRDYALVIRYMLLRWFRIEYVVEDIHAAWFHDAQVKTMLLVARRIPRLVSVASWTDETYLHVELPSGMSDGKSLISGGRLAKSRQPERAFAKKARAVLEGKSDDLADAATWTKVRLADQASTVMRRAAEEQWLISLEPNVQANKAVGHVIPSGLADWFGGFTRFETLRDLGVDVGQGLRTGANDFFYADLVEASSGFAKVRVSPLFDRSTISLPTACVRPVVRRQADIRSLVVAPANLTGVVLAFHGWALPEHAEAARAKPLPELISEHVRRAGLAKVGEKALPTLSAVAPNARKANPRTGAPTRFWYMLPDFAPRHLPDLFVPRVNGATPSVSLNPQRQALVDANFSTLWTKDRARVTVPALLAFLNGSLARALYECSGAVMGGGALKLEATHLRSLPLPALSNHAWDRLDALGVKLATDPAAKPATIVRQTDRLVLGEMFGTNSIESKLDTLRAIIRQKQSTRAKRHDASART